MRISSITAALVPLALFVAALGVTRSLPTNSAEYPQSRSAAELFKKYCADCHGKDGRSQTMKSKLKYHARNLTDPQWQESVTDERVFNSIVRGKGKMPAFGKKLTDDESESLVKYVRAFKT